MACLWQNIPSQPYLALSSPFSTQPQSNAKEQRENLNDVIEMGEAANLSSHSLIHAWHHRTASPGDPTRDPLSVPPCFLGIKPTLSEFQVERGFSSDFNEWREQES